MYVIILQQRQGARKRRENNQSCLGDWDLWAKLLSATAATPGGGSQRLVLPQTPCYTHLAGKHRAASWDKSKRQMLWVMCKAVLAELLARLLAAGNMSQEHINGKRGASEEGQMGFSSGPMLSGRRWLSSVTWYQAGCY